ncbi:hypothetical protein [Burkholderia sp. LMG 32019]|uniref:hypothetical protein n=1 Tax=Burkholderia sp. LMG 32019 TaxID=3158173 RepID=UPI003C2F9EB7
MKFDLADSLEVLDLIGSAFTAPPDDLPGLPQSPASRLVRRWKRQRRPVGVLRTSFGDSSRASSNAVKQQNVPVS